VYDKIVIENNKKKMKYGNKSTFYSSLHAKDGLGIEFTTC